MSVIWFSLSTTQSKSSGQDAQETFLWERNKPGERTINTAGSNRVIVVQQKNTPSDSCNMAEST